MLFFLLVHRQLVVACIPGSSVNLQIAFDVQLFPARQPRERYFSHADKFQKFRVREERLEPRGAVRGQPAKLLQQRALPATS